MIIYNMRISPHYCITLHPSILQVKNWPLQIAENIAVIYVHLQEHVHIVVKFAITFKQIQTKLFWVCDKFM